MERSRYTKEYDTMERFISYFHQTDLALKTNPAKILEIGVGNRTFSNYMKENGVTVVTCDIDETLKPDHVADITKLPFSDNEFDTVVAFEVLEHIPYDQFETALSEMSRVSKKNVIISIPYACAYVEGVFKAHLPIIKKTIDIPLKIPYFFTNIKNEEHMWEMGDKDHSKSKVRKAISKNFTIKQELSPKLNKYHHFFVLEKR